MTKTELDKILEEHKKWLRDEGGKRANLNNADLQGADLRGAYLQDAYLQGADLQGADLRGAYLRGADLQGADLQCADLRGAYLQCAYLQGAYLQDAYLQGADLRKTCLDPSNSPNGDVTGFTTDGNLCIGYRTPNSINIDPSHIYEPGKTYEAPHFSTSDTDCHPGLYVRPVREDGDIEVRFLPADCHHAWDKWRVKKFTVKETA